MQTLFHQVSSKNQLIDYQQIEGRIYYTGSSRRKEYFVLARDMIGHY
ncbi:MAG: hypothetical protein R3B93_15865 [Bacteroidia bacterium]